MKITKKNLERLIKEEISKIINEQRKEIEEDVVVNGKKYKLLGQILTMFGKTRVDLRLVDPVTGEVFKAKSGEDINKVKAALGIKQPTK